MGWPGCVAHADAHAATGSWFNGAVKPSCRHLQSAALVAFASAAACSHPSPSPAPTPAPSPEAPPASTAATAPSETILFRKPSRFGEVFVVQNGPQRCLTLDTPKDIQSCIVPAEPGKVVHEYVRYLTAGLLVAPDAPRTLMIGLGGGSVVGIMRSAAPGIRFEIVEINDAVVEAARRWFGITESASLHVHVGDGRAFVEGARSAWDMIVLDAFSSEGIPPQLGTEEFLRAIRGRTAPDGVVVANLWNTDPVLYKNMLRTYREVFPATYVFEGRESGNVIVISLRGELDGGCTTFRTRAGDARWNARLSFDLSAVASVCTPIGAVDLAGSRVLRDAEWKGMGDGGVR